MNPQSHYKKLVLAKLSSFVKDSHYPPALLSANASYLFWYTLLNSDKIFKAFWEITKVKLFIQLFNIVQTLIPFPLWNPTCYLLYYSCYHCPHWLIQNKHSFLWISMHSNSLARFRSLLSFSKSDLQKIHITTTNFKNSIFSSI